MKPRVSEKSAPLRLELGRLAQVPLAQLDRVIAHALQQLADGDLAGRHAHLGGRDDVLLAVGEIDRVADAIVMGAHIAGELQVHGRELEAVAGRIAAGQQGRAGRRAGAVAGVGLGEIGALPADGIDVGRRDRPAGDAAAVEADVIVAQVIGDDDDDVRLAARLGRCGRARLPDHVARRADLELDPGDGNAGRRLGGRGGRQPRGHQAGHGKQGELGPHPAHSTRLHEQVWKRSGDRAGRGLPGRNRLELHAGFDAVRPGRRVPADETRRRRRAAARDEGVERLGGLLGVVETRRSGSGRRRRSATPAWAS